MNLSRIFFYLLIVILLVVIVFFPSLGWRLRALLSPAIPVADNKTAAAELALKAQLDQYAILASQLPAIPKEYVPATVYSRYPTNFRNQILVNAGTNQGVAAGRAVLIEIAGAGNSPSFIFVGRVQAAFANTAVVQTIFDPAFRMPVRIGTHGFDALFAGGSEPKTVSILKSATIQAGDAVVSADPAFPYGLPVASVHAVDIASDGLFQEAALDFPYDLNAIQAVLIQK